MTDLIVPSRRGFLLGMTAAITAPAIVRVASIMPVRAIRPDLILDEFCQRIMAPYMNKLADAVADSIIYGTGTAHTPLFDLTVTDAGGLRPTIEVYDYRELYDFKIDVKTGLVGSYTPLKGPWNK